MALSYPNFRILVVDNGSSDNSETILRERLPELEVLQTGFNLGFAGGNNVGIRYALEQGADYIWLLNNDTEVHPQALSALVEVAQGDFGVGIVGSKILYHDDRRLLWYAGAYLDSHHAYRPCHRGLNEVDRGQYDNICETGYVTGCSLLTRRAMVEAIGLLDEELFLYFEDVDWCARAKAAGWKLIYCPRSQVHHKISVSTGGAASPSLLYYTSRNRLYFVKRNFPVSLPAAVVYDLYEHVLVNLKKGRFAAAWAAVRGVADFIKGRSGRFQG